MVPMRYRSLQQIFAAVPRAPRRTATTTSTSSSSFSTSTSSRAAARPAGSGRRSRKTTAPLKWSSRQQHVPDSFVYDRQPRLDRRAFAASPRVPSSGVTATPSPVAFRHAPRHGRLPDSSATEFFDFSNLDNGDSEPYVPTSGSQREPPPTKHRYHSIIGYQSMPPLEIEQHVEYSLPLKASRATQEPAERFHDLKTAAMPILHGLEQVLAPEDRIKQAFSRMLHVLSAQPNRQELLQHLEVELHCVIHMVHQALSRSEALATMAFDRLAGSIKAQVREVLRLLGLLIASDEASSVPPAWQLSVHESEQLVVGVMLRQLVLLVMVELQVCQQHRTDHHRATTSDSDDESNDADESLTAENVASTLIRELVALHDTNSWAVAQHPLATLERSVVHLVGQLDPHRGFWRLLDRLLARNAEACAWSSRLAIQHSAAAVENSEFLWRLMFHFSALAQAPITLYRPLEDQPQTAHDTPALQGRSQLLQTLLARSIAACKTVILGRSTSGSLEATLVEEMKPLLWRCIRLTQVALCAGSFSDSDLDHYRTAVLSAMECVSAFLKLLQAAGLRDSSETLPAFLTVDYRGPPITPSFQSLPSDYSSMHLLVLYANVLFYHCCAPSSSFGSQSESMWCKLSGKLFVAVPSTPQRIIHWNHDAASTLRNALSIILLAAVYAPERQHATILHRITSTLFAWIPAGNEAHESVCADGVR